MILILLLILPTPADVHALQSPGLSSTRGTKRGASFCKPTGLPIDIKSFLFMLLLVCFARLKDISVHFFMISWMARSGNDCALIAQYGCEKRKCSSGVVQHGSTIRCTSESIGEEDDVNPLIEIIRVEREKRYCCTRYVFVIHNFWSTMHYVLKI